MGAQLGGDAAFAEINMTPLIDIVLVVLIIMMVNIPIEVQELGVKVPSSLNKPPPPPTDDVQQLMVAIYENGDIALNRMIINKEPKLREQISRRLLGMSKKNVFVDAHPKVPLSDVVDMLDLARESGAEQVGFAKIKDQGPLAAVGVAEGAMPRDVIAGNPTVVDRLEKEELDNVTVYAVLQKILPGIRACYFGALAGNPTMTGDYLVEVTIGPKGTQMEPHEFLKDSLRDPAVQQCVSPLIEQLSYPALSDDNTAVIRYPLLFSPG